MLILYDFELNFLIFSDILEELFEILILNMHTLFAKFNLSSLVWLNRAEYLRPVWQWHSYSLLFVFLKQAGIIEIIKFFQIMRLNLLICHINELTSLGSYVS